LTTNTGCYLHSRELYFKSDVQTVVSYARQRGVIVVPEMDAPAHASAGWGQWADADPAIGRYTIHWFGKCPGFSIVDQ
jgi:hypothetical protein